MSSISVADLRERAKARLPRFLFEYLDGGAGAETAMRANIADLESVALRQRVLTGIDDISVETDFFGTSAKLPVALAPVGLAGMYARRGEVQAVRAASKFGVPFTLSTVSVCPLEEVAAAASPFWFQLYMIRDRGFMRDLLASARENGCTALVFTVDMPLPGTRYRDYRSGLAGASGIAGSMRRIGQSMAHPRWALDVGVRGRPHHLGNVVPVLQGRSGLSDFFAWMRENFDPNVTWRDLDEVRAAWDGPLIVKGVLDVEDARAAADAGADGIVVSNHGGRQLDAAISSAYALPGIADAVGDRLAVLADGGIRSGLDVVRMLALGACGVMLGRPWVYALAAEGGAGITRMLHQLETEIRTAMVLTGHRAIADIGSGALAR